MRDNFFLLSITLISLSLPRILFAQSEHPLHQGIYSAEQASRGEASFMASCASCHANDLRGNSNSPGLVGVGFLFLWEDRPLAELFNKMRSEMPTDRPGSLSTAVYLDLLAFILQRNGYPAGDSDLSGAVAEEPTVLIVAPP
ncbi:MAG: cytochrome c [Pseudomonadales bacterium]|nr:cytochrome c [Pseudomonadales bacterium]